MKHFNFLVVILVTIVVLAFLAILEVDFYIQELIISSSLIALVILLLIKRSTYSNLKSLEDEKCSLREALEVNNQAFEALKQEFEESQEDLEIRVQERTLELNITLQELEDVNQELEQKTTIDELTGLYNRRYYDQKLLAEFRRSRRNLTPFSLVIIDIDHFKKINDDYGHSAGDKCLSGLAALIKKSLRRSADIGCRYGGEEFCLLLPETELKGAVALSEEIRELAADQKFKVDDVLISFTISCGISTYHQENNVKPIDIFNAADKALYFAKNNGRNQVQSQDILVLEAEAIQEE